MAEGPKRDIEGLKNFLELAIRSGYVNSSTGNNRIRITNDILTTVPNIDTSDVTQLDIEDIFRRYAVLNAGKLSAANLQGNKSHFKSALREFSIYLNDPVHYRPSAGRSKKESTSKVQQPKQKETGKNQIPEIAKSGETSANQGKTSPTIHIDFQIHIAPETDPTLVDKIFESLSKYFPSK